jgi:hypothetical protein
VTPLSSSTQQLPIPPSLPDITQWSFRHTPHRSRPLHTRWPSALESQAKPADRLTTLLDVWIWVDPYLTSATQSTLRGLNRSFHLGPRFGPLWFYRPWSPHRRRRWGFGIPSKACSATHEEPSPYTALHYAWVFLEPQDRLTATKTCTAWSQYHHLRYKAVTTSLLPLRLKRAPPGNPSQLPQDRSLLYACALLRFHFYYGDFIRWLGGEYTNRNKDWTAMFIKMVRACRRSPPLDLPPVDFQRGYRISTGGVPLKGIFDSPYIALRDRDQYDNHPAVASNLIHVESKFAKEEEKSFHIHLPRFLVYFIYGLMLNPIQWAVRKGKGRICIDCTNGQNGADTTSSANTFIPRPKDGDLDACPPVHYATAFMRHLQHLWRLRITFPIADILQHCDDIDAAFRRVLYTPELAIVFAYVFSSYLLIPVGQVFGSRSAPSYFSLLSDIRAFVATCGDLITGHPMHPLAAAAGLPPEPLPSELAPAIADSLNQPLSLAEQACPSNCTFVDDNGVMSLRSEIRVTLHNSIIAAFLLFGWPHEDRRSSCLAPDKWERDVNFDILYLGFRICSRSLRVTWPFYKRQELYDEIMAVLNLNRPWLKPKGTASIIGKLRSANLIAPWGPYLSFSLALALNHAVRTSYEAIRRWWQRGRVWISKSVQQDLRIVANWLLEPEYSPVWSSYIGLLVPRVATHTILSDASYAGIGGWSPDFAIQWRVTREDLVLLGFNMKHINKYQQEPLDAQTAGLHINPLEYLAAIVNLWLVLKLVVLLPPLLTGYIVDLLSDNTSALSWMHLTAQTRDPRLQPLARLTSTMLVRARCHLTRVQPKHIPGDDNFEADTLSRSENGRTPSWERVISRCSQLRPCQICLLPPELLSSLAGLISSGLTEDTYESLTTRLLTLAFVTLPAGSTPSALTSSLRSESTTTSPLT